jgi:hypothetical protein
VPHTLPYSPIIADLVFPRRLGPLGPGAPDVDARAKLEALRLETAFAPHPVRDRDMATACLAGLWLYHNFIGDAHFVAEDIQTTTGFYWHALVHRREPDFNNAAYWFRRVGQHPVFVPLRDAAAGAALAAGELEPAAGFLLDQPRWDPFAFNALCAAVLEEKAAGASLCREVQQREWELLFDYCYRHAIGDNALS